VEVAVDGDNGRKSAGADAGYYFDAEHAVACGLAGFDAEFAFDTAEQSGAAFNMAGGATADLNGPFAVRTEAELVVESGDAIDFACRQIKGFANFNYRFARDESLCFLYCCRTGMRESRPGLEIFWMIFLPRSC
jgi:hypothetical protein